MDIVPSSELPEDPPVFALTIPSFEKESFTVRVSYQRTTRSSSFQGQQESKSSVTDSQDRENSRESNQHIQESVAESEHGTGWSVYSFPEDMDSEERKRVITGLVHHGYTSAAFPIAEKHGIDMLECYHRYRLKAAGTGPETGKFYRVGRSGAPGYNPKFGFTITDRIYLADPSTDSHVSRGYKRRRTGSIPDEDPDKTLTEANVARLPQSSPLVKRMGTIHSSSPTWSTVPPSQSDEIELVYEVHPLYSKSHESAKLELYY
ncbi:hypothetical protein V5O48_007183 [Marasmius crinis-equi]|uniref:Uncharacterized protein n=1 Tax=Marasmius crinis-equi TaxID=585013 RepID=A0ABR3FHF3_9AGAR